MAALTGSLTADFSGFVTEVDKSVVALHSLESAAAGTQGGFGEFSAGLSAVDKTLGLFGVKIGPVVSAVRELGTVLNTSASALGVWGTAAAAAAAATAGWKIGTWVAEWSGLDQDIGDAAASLLGWGDAAERTKARIDVLSRASVIAKTTITDFDQALKIIKDSNAAMSESLNTGTERVRQWTAEIARVRASGDLPKITEELKNKTSTLKEIATHYNISERALSYYMQTLEASKKAQKEWADEARERYAKLAEAQANLDQLGGGWKKTLDSIAPATAAVVTQYLSLGASQDDLVTKFGLTTVQVNALSLALKEQTATLALQEPALGTLDQFMRNLPPAILEAGKSTQFFDQQLMASIATVEAEAVPALEKLETTFRSVTEAAREAAEPVSKNAPGSVGVNLGGVAFGGVSPEAALKAYTARFGTGSAAGMIGGGPAPDFLSWAMSMGLASKGTQFNNTFNVVDTESEIARRVAEEINRQVRSGSLVNV